MRKRFIAAIVAAFSLFLGAVGLGVGLNAATATSPSAAPASTISETDELETLSVTDDADESDSSTGTAPDSTPNTPPATTEESVESVEEPVEVDLDGADQLPTLVADTQAPTTYWQVAPADVVKAGSVVSIRLRAQGEADGTIIAKSISLDGALRGSITSTHRNYDFRLDTTGLADGVHTLTGVAVDPAGNRAEAIATFVVDGTGPTVTVKPTSSGSGTAYTELDLKLFDAAGVDRVRVNGIEKDLTDNRWSDVNDIRVGAFGIVEGTPFTVVAYDVLGNTSTSTFVIDTTAPSITVKPESVGGPSVFRTLSLKLYDRHQIDYVVVNGEKKDLSNNPWSDVNGLTVGQFGIQDGTPFTVTAVDVAGNSTTQTFTLDASGPTITVKPESVGGSAAYQLLSLKLYDKFQVDYVVVNGVTKQLTNNQWSDVNGIKVGQYGIVDNVPFLVEAFDVLGNKSEAWFVFDLTGPSITVKPDMSVGGPAYYSSLSLKLHDAYQVDAVKVNGILKDLTNNAWSDVNFITVGSFGIQDGVPFTVEAFDVYGNSSAATFTLDGTAPTIDEKSRTSTSVSLKFFDRFQVDYVVINGVHKDLTNNQWSDANDLRVGTFGIQDGQEFFVTIVDVAGNRTTLGYILTVENTNPDPQPTLLTAPVDESAEPVVESAEPVVEEPAEQ